jgi:hypothetical protein
MIHEIWLRMHIGFTYAPSQTLTLGRAQQVSQRPDAFSTLGSFIERGRLPRQSGWPQVTNAWMLF